MFIDTYIQFVEQSVVVVTCIMLYLLPTILGKADNNKNVFIIGLINIFLGWTIVGWIIALLICLVKDDNQTKQTKIR